MSASTLNGPPRLEARNEVSRLNQAPPAVPELGPVGQPDAPFEVLPEKSKWGWVSAIIFALLLALAGLGSYGGISREAVVEFVSDAAWRSVRWSAEKRGLEIDAEAGFLSAAVAAGFGTYALWAAALIFGITRVPPLRRGGVASARTVTSVVLLAPASFCWAADKVAYRVQRAAKAGNRVALKGSVKAAPKNGRLAKIVAKRLPNPVA